MAELLQETAKAVEAEVKALQHQIAELQAGKSGGSDEVPTLEALREDAGTILTSIQRESTTKGALTLELQGLRGDLEQTQRTLHILLVRYPLVVAPLALCSLFQTLYCYFFKRRPAGRQRPRKPSRQTAVLCRGLHYSTSSKLKLWFFKARKQPLAQACPSSMLRCECNCF